MTSTIPPHRNPHPLDRALHALNSVLVFWFFAFAVSGPKASHATTALLALSLATLPATMRKGREIWEQAAPWLIGLSAYCAYQIAYRLLDSGLDARFDPPARYLGAIPILFHLARYGFRIEALWAGIAAGCLVGGTAGIHEVLFDGVARAGAGHHPIAYGSMLALLTMTALHGATTATPPLWRITLCAGVVAGLAGILLSGTRGLYPVLATCVALICYWHLRRRAISPRRLVLAIAGPLVAVTAIALQVPTVEQRIEETRQEYVQLSDGNLETSFGHRLQMWHVGIFIITERPLFGLGPHVSARLPFARSFIAENGYNEAVLTLYDHLHNLFINEAATFGLVGLALLVLLLHGALGRMNGPSREVLMIAVLVISLEGLTETVLNHQRFMILFVMLATVLRAQQIAAGSEVQPVTLADRASQAESDAVAVPRAGGNRAHP